MSIRWGLCCQFRDSPIRFRQATYRYVSSLPTAEASAYLADIARSNAIALAHAVERCSELGIRAFRITSQIIPLATHPGGRFRLDDLPGAEVIAGSFRAAGRVAAERGIRLSFHPDQFVVLNSEREDVVRPSIAELEFQATMAELVGADAICLHGGSAAGGRFRALDRLRRGIDRLSPEARRRLALENDDRSFTVRDLLPVCESEGVPLIYDVHHHRINGDGLPVDVATDLARDTWRGCEQWVHISSPRDGWRAGDTRSHAEYIDPLDFPAAWHDRALTIDVEAKAKELAVLALRAAVARSTPRRRSRGPHPARIATAGRRR